MKIPHHILVASSGWGGRIVGAFVQILVIRLVVRTLGADHYAAFALLYSLAGWFQLADCGLGFALQNFISRSRARGVGYDRVLTNVVKLAFSLVAIELVLLSLLSPWAGGQLLRQFGFIGNADKYVIFFSACTLQLLAGIGQVAYKVWYGEQKGYLSNILPAVSQLIGLGAAIVTLHFKGQLESLILAYLIPPALVGLLSLGKIWREHSVSAQSSDVEMRPILRKAMEFGGFGFAAAAVLQVDMPIISQYLPPRQIATYAVISRVFAFVFVIYTSALAALWPVCAELLAIHKWESVKRYVRTYILGGSAVVAIMTALVAAKLNLIVSVMAPSAGLEVPLTVLAMFGVYYIVRVWTDTYAMVLQCRSNLRPMWFSTPIQAVLSIGLQIILIKRFGLQGAVLGQIGSFLFTAAWILPWSAVKMRRADNEFSKAMDAELVGVGSDL